MLLRRQLESNSVPVRLARKLLGTARALRAFADPAGSVEEKTTAFKNGEELLHAGAVPLIGGPVTDAEAAEAMETMVRLYELWQTALPATFASDRMDLWRERKRAFDAVQAKRFQFAPGSLANSTSLR